MASLTVRVAGKVPGSLKLTREGNARAGKLVSSSDVLVYLQASNFIKKAIIEAVVFN